MSGSFEQTVVVIDAMSFRRARDECFLAPWAKQEGVELISVRLDEAHAKLVDDFDSGMLIHDVGGASPSSHEILAEIQILRTLRPAAALVILTHCGRPHLANKPANRSVAIEQRTSSICRERIIAVAFKVSISGLLSCPFSSSAIRLLNAASSECSRSMS
jgi:hypothetical protein